MADDLKPLDYKSLRVGIFPDRFFEEMPTDAAKSQVLDKAGVPYQDPDSPADPHPLRAALKHTHGDDDATNIRRVTPPFPAPGDAPPQTVGDYFRALDAASAVPPKPEDGSKPEAVTPEAPAPDGPQAA